MFERAAAAAVVACSVGALVACGGGGDSGSSGSGGSSGGSSGASRGGASPYLLFACDSAGSLAAFTTLSPAAGTSVTANVVESIPFGCRALAYDSGRDELYEAWNDVFVTGVTSKLEVFAQASGMKAGVAASRIVSLPDLLAIDRVVLDTAHDRLWISGSDSNSQGIVAVYDHASTLSGTAAASRILRVDGFDLAIDAGRDILYTNPFGDEVYVYANASTLSGAVRPDRIIGHLPATAGLVLDASRDALYMTDNSNDIYIVQGASSATTATVATIRPPASFNLLALAVDAAHDRLYAGGQDGAWVIDNVSTLSAGTTPATRVQAPGAVVTAFAFAGQ